MNRTRRLGFRGHGFGEENSAMPGGIELRIRKREVQLKQSEKQFWGFGVHGK